MLSYCYDIETGFYYLQTRYYDPAIARFINADGYLSTDATGLLSYNMFAYCENNPVMYSDIGGSVRNYCVNMTDGGSYRVNVQLDDNFYVPNDKNIDKTKNFYNNERKLFDHIAETYGSPDSSYYLYYSGQKVVTE